MLNYRVKRSSSNRPSIRRLLVISTLAGAVTLAGCGDDATSDESSDAPTATDLDGRTFVSTGVEGETLIEGSSVSLNFTASTLSAQGGCNTMTGGYTIEGTSLVAETLAQTMKACDPASEAQDQWISALLQGRPTIALDGGVLSLENDDVALTLEE